MVGYSIPWNVFCGKKSSVQWSSRTEQNDKPQGSFNIKEQTQKEDLEKSPSEAQGSVETNPIIYGYVYKFIGPN